MTGSMLHERLAHGPILCAEGYLFELERRGYLQAGAYVPEVVLERPEAVDQLHREFVHAGSDVVEAFTYYGHREKLRLIGKEHLLEPLNRDALQIARAVARETGTLLAGDVCNTNLWSDEPASRRAVRAMFDEQVAWAAEAGVDFVIAETFQFARRGAAWPPRRSGRPGSRRSSRWRSTATRSRARAGRRRRRAGGSPTPARRSSGSTASAARRRCCRCSAAIRAAVDVPVAALPVPYHTHEAEPTFQSLGGGRRVPGRARPVHLDPLRRRGLRARRARARRRVPRAVLRRGAAPHPRDGRGDGPAAAGEPLLARHVQARLPRHRPEPAGGEPRLRGAAVAMYRYAVIGGGGIGSAAAYWLEPPRRRRGPVPRAVGARATGRARPRTTRGSSGSGTTAPPTRR